VRARIAGRRQHPGTLQMRLLLHDSAYTDRLAAFLRSVGQRPVPAGPLALEVADTEPAEIEVYLRVWRVLYPEAGVRLQA
jgi:hypothetical protein